MLFATLLSGQAFTEHAAAIAGASAGVAGARALRDPLTRILQSASEVATPAPPAGNAALTAYPTASTPSQTPPPAFAPSPSAPPAARPGWRRGSGGNTRPVLSATQTVFSLYESTPYNPPVTADQLQAVASGASRSEVVGRLGVPSGRITMDDNGHLVEILQYSSHGVRVGSVRCNDGRVESVNTANR